MATRAFAPSAQVTGGFKLDAFVDRHFMWIGLALFLQGGPGDTIEWGARMAAGVMVIVPSLIFFPARQRSHRTRFGRRRGQRLSQETTATS